MRDFTIGGVLRRATLLLSGHAGLFLLLTLLLVALPQVLLSMLLLKTVPDRPGLVGFATFWYWIGGTFIQAIVTRVAIDDAARRTSSLGELAGTAARFFFPIVVISLLSGIAVGLGFVLLIFPALMLLCRWYLVFPVEVAERSGIFAAFRRSAELTYGDRWRIFGLLLLLALIGIVVALAGGLIGRFVGGLSHDPWPALAGRAIGSALTQLIVASANTSAYLTLRELKEGTLSQDLVAVFE